MSTLKTCRDGVTVEGWLWFIALFSLTDTAGVHTGSYEQQRREK
ncbi:MAG: hypothetical protein PVH03_11235 [Chloroflexota bacterium]